MRSLMMDISHDDAEIRLEEEDAEGPLSTGVEQMRPIDIDVGPFPEPIGGAGATSRSSRCIAR